MTAAQLATGIILGSPGSSAATYTLPTVALWEALVELAHRLGLRLQLTNVNGSGSGAITLGSARGGRWRDCTVAATAGTSGMWRARKTGDGAWTAYRRA